MASDMEKPPVTEIKVRIDCNGCVQKIKKALHGVPGIYDIYVDFPEQKVTITGWADPNELVKAIRKTRKSAVICVHTEESDAAEPPPEGETTPEEDAPPENTNPQAEVAQPHEPSQQESPLPATATSQPHHPPVPNNIEGVRIVYHHPSDQGQQNPYSPNHQQDHARPWDASHMGPGFRNERYHPPQPVYVQSYNTYRPPPHATEYAYPKPPPKYSYNSSPSHYSGPGIRDEPPQPAQPINTYPCSPPRYSYNRSGHYSGPGLRDELPQPINTYPCSPPRYSYYSRPSHYSGTGLRDEPPQPPHHVYATHSYNTYKPSSYVTRYENPPSPPKTMPYKRADNNGGPGLKDEGESSQPPETLYATHRHHIYKSSPYSSEYVYAESPSTYPSYSLHRNYSRDNYNRNHENGNVTSMFSEENPNACTIV